MEHLELPEPIANYFDADRRGGKAVADCFVARGVVIDESRTHTGPAEIEAWRMAAAVKYAYVAEPFSLEKQGSGYIVKSHVTGNFPGSPVDLQYIFTLERGKIATLKVTS